MVDDKRTKNHDLNGGIVAVATWPEPLPLISKIESEPYPIDALPNMLRAAVEEVQNFTKAPVALVASSALAALSVSAQAHLDVKRAENLHGPVGLFLLTIACSGERKSTCDGFFMRAIRDYEARQAELAEPNLKDHQAVESAWESKRAGIKDKIRTLAKAGNPTDEQEIRLRVLEQDKPVPQRVPRLIYGDFTPEALRWSLAKVWPSGGVISSEAGMIFGSHGMGNDSIMRNLATLNQLWDGADISTERRTTESFIVRGARLTMGLQVQEATIRSFFERTGELARGIGFFARFLVSKPESTQGYRPFTEPPESWPALAKFNKRITVILEQTVPMEEEGVLDPPVLPLAADAKVAWILFHDAIENELRLGGELYDVRDVASKIADNAVRIAALFQIFEYEDTGSIGLEAFEGAQRIAAWHLNEARRFYGELALSEEQANVMRLDTWLVDHCRKTDVNYISRRETQQNIIPACLRKKENLDDALKELVEINRARLVQDGRRKDIYINPALLGKVVP